MNKTQQTLKYKVIKVNPAFYEHLKQIKEQITEDNHKSHFHNLSWNNFLSYLVHCAQYYDKSLILKHE